MRLLVITVFILISNFIFASEISIIELHTQKSLDQLVLEKNETKDEDKELVDDSVSDNNIDEHTENQNINNSEEVNQIVEEQVVLDIKSFWETVEYEKLDVYLKNINSINSQPIYNEFVNKLIDFNFDSNDILSKDVFYLLINKLVELGEIQKAYNFMQSVDLTNDDRLVFYKSLELNYLFSTYQLSEACALKDELNLLQIKLPNYYLEKTDIFCLIMEDKVDEADLLNSILNETEKNKDNFFQNLLNILLIEEKNDNRNLTLPENYFEDLVFLYSAMLRIAELPLNQKILEIDPNNLSIPIILSNSTAMDLRLKAANKAFLNELISIESLAALYQSVDFTSSQLNNPSETIISLNNNTELIMAYYYQLANIQIFPSSRMNVIIDFWKFAKEIELEEIAYKLSDNIIKTLEPSIDYLDEGLDIAMAFINNEDFENALKWISFVDNNKNEKTQLEQVKLVYELHQSDNLDSLFTFINLNYKNISSKNNSKVEEFLYVTSSVIDENQNIDSKLSFENIMDERPMPTIFLISEINRAIINNDESNLFLLLLMTLNQKEWNEIHPEHLKLILIGIKEYKDSELLKIVLLDIFKNVKIF